MSRRALLVGIDGFNLPRIDDLDGDAPTLRRLRAEAAFAPSRIYPDGATMTVSGPGWSTILTGVWPDKHRVLDNSIAGHALAAFPDFLTRAHPHVRTFYAASWPPLYDQILTTQVAHRHVVPGHIDAAVDAATAAAARQALAADDFDLGFVYFGSLDEAAHAHGSTSAEYDAAIRAVDGHLADLLDAIAGRPTYAEEDWLVAVTTDHGHRPEGGHGGQSDAERSTFVILQGQAVDRARMPQARIVDLAPTLLHHVGVPIEPGWQLDGRTLLEESR